MAVKYLKGRLYTSYVTWNARLEDRHPAPEFDEEHGTLSVATTITVPDTGHRHLAYYLIGLWKENPAEVPARVKVDGTQVERDEILEALDEVDLENEYVFCDVYTLEKVREGYLYAEFNDDSKPPQRAVALDLTQTKTPARRFVYALIDRCPIFSREEIETRGNTIGSKSRKLTTNSTLEGAVRPFETRLIKLEDTPDYDDLIEFTCSFYEAWADIYTAFEPESSRDARHGLREETFAVSNIMFHPMFRIVFELWGSYRKEEVDWRSDPKWREVVAKIGGKISIEDPDDPGTEITVKVMARDTKDGPGNPNWRGRILIRKFNQDGSPAGWSLSNTRQTRDAAYSYLREVAGLTNNSEKSVV
jgi:hypothetical protein